jgi:3'-phosphoadenosine 5'-phosphosulfate sulfotransferase (PAPS reductase)/FAD synthetase
VKVEPFQEALEDLNAEAFLSGRMRWQSPERSNLPIVEKKGAVVVINPIADLGQEAVERFFNNPYLPERDKNYFDPAKGDGQLLECGLNTAIYRGRED